ncbi:uncharacterized protein TRAVEDRAFT_148001 [Trametes versicolor FP-101664 SS1]|uniref:uncharacterized protein n=1 Tax=Trametes versicolor (strain FP-101664) TaxID=717944 RepID=UPI0004622F87|nr:uncharacterized protein TRAVEDRAFT_148001 [Trametes versicolor FP-101664 SS1]EIW59831.1 hypothetical protein TRAVEDRAFT_148001 [Trametes versicolor FP-101664 SS1]
MFATLRRLYATIPEAAATARTASTPRAVRIRRAQQGIDADVASQEHDATPEGLTPSEFTRYQRALAKGELLRGDGSTLTEAEWLEKLDARRTRIRGVRQVKKDGQTGSEVVGQKVFLPNIIFKMVRNHTPAGQPYNPYEATFRVPQSVTKTDVRSYLLAVYGVQTTYIRTDNYVSPLRRAPGRTATTFADRTYKRAVVGLVEPFYYPQAEEDMPKEERDKRQKFTAERLLVGQGERNRKLYFLRATRAVDGGKKGWKWRTGTTASRGNILRLIAERRAEREEAVENVKARIREDRRQAPTEAA